MSADDSELTFIRCPSCRSLVPAVASRCRMCGTALAGSTESKTPTAPNEDQLAEKASRVRKKTISLEGEEAVQPRERAEAQPKRVEVSQVVETPKESVSPVSKFLKYGLKDQGKAAPEAPEKTESAPEQPVAKAQSGREPLRFGKVSNAVAVASAAKPQAPKEEEVYEEEEEELGEFLDESIPEPKDEILESFEEDGDDFDEGDEDEDDGEDEASPAAGPQLTKSQKRRLRKKKKIAMAGMQEQPAPQPFEAPRPPQPAPRQQIQQPPRSLAPERPAPVAAQPVQQKSVEVEKKTMSQFNQTTNEAPRSVKAKTEGRLIGWLVTYLSDFRGAPIEIREGRFFIGGAKLRDTDLVLADESLSVPHCLVKAEGKDGLVMQDLMSEKGTFIKRQGASAYEAITMPTVIEHGDWIKFGDYELMACIVPSDGRTQKQ
ncbi:MAG: FHA domain-containing protein [Deltaproteobacteria bacterium]|nr:FHA domain-containing protein [Deltaproteobacteria bacterium]